MVDVIIVGAGPAGLAAGIYAKRAGLDAVVLDSSPISGGQILNTYEVDNYPGLPGVSGVELANHFKEHAVKLGVEFAKGRVTSITKDEGMFSLHTKKETFDAKSVIVATGASNKLLGCPGEEEFSGLGVSYCATCDGAFFKDKTVAVIGGGDVALEDALFLARGCKKVYMILRRDQFRGAKVLQEQVMAASNIEVIYDSLVEAIEGETCVERILIKNKNNDNMTSLSVEGVFVAVGTVPNTGAIKGLPEQDLNGYIKAGEDCITSIPGIFAAGDVRTKQLRQIVTAAADGANAITSLQRYFQGN